MLEEQTTSFILDVNFMSKFVPSNPSRYLAPDPKVVIWDELGGSVGTLVGHAEGVHMPEDDDWNGGKEESLFPGLISTCSKHFQGINNEAAHSY